MADGPSGPEGRGRNMAPPVFSHRIAGRVYNAKLLEFKLKHPKRPLTPAQKRGLAYEKKFLRDAGKLFPSLICHPAFAFTSDRHHLTEHAIPDAILISGNVLNIFEIKYTHTTDAWYQLHRLYKPIVQSAFPSYQINLIEVCKNYDPRVSLAGKITFIEDLFSHCMQKQDGFGIYLWSGRG